MPAFDVRAGLFLELARHGIVRALARLNLTADTVQQSALPFGVELTDQGDPFSTFREAEAGYVVQVSCPARGIASIIEIISLL